MLIEPLFPMKPEQASAFFSHQKREVQRKNDKKAESKANPSKAAELHLLFGSILAEKSLKIEKRSLKIADILPRVLSKPLPSSQIPTESRLYGLEQRAAISERLANLCSTTFFIPKVVAFCCEPERKPDATVKKPELKTNLVKQPENKPNSVRADKIKGEKRTRNLRNLM